MKRSRAALVAACVVVASQPAAAADADFESCRVAAVAAQRLHASQRLLEERAELLACARADCPDVIQASCRRWLDANDAARPSVVVVAKDSAGGDVVGATFTLDDASDARAVDGASIELDPGAHTLHAKAKERAPVDLEIVVAVGVKLRMVTVTWPAPHPPSVAPTPSPPPGVESRPVPTRVLVLGSAAAVALGTASVFGVLAWRKYDELRASNSPDQQPLPTYRVAGDIALGVGVVLVGIALWQYLARPAVRVAPSAASWRIQFAQSSL